MHRAGRSRSSPLDPDDDAGAARVALDDRGFEADLAQLGDDVVGRLALPRPAAVAVVGAVDPDQVAAQAHDLVDGAGGGLGDLAHAVQTRRARVCRAAGSSAGSVVRWAVWEKGLACVLSFRVAAGTPQGACSAPCPGGGMADALA